MKKKVKLTKRRGYYTISLIIKFIRALKWENVEYLELEIEDDKIIIRNSVNNC